MYKYSWIVLSVDCKCFTSIWMFLFSLSYIVRCFSSLRRPRGHVVLYRRESRLESADFPVDHSNSTYRWLSVDRGAIQADSYTCGRRESEHPGQAPLWYSRRKLRYRTKSQMGRSQSFHLVS